MLLFSQTTPRSVVQQRYDTSNVCTMWSSPLNSWASTYASYEYKSNVGLVFDEFICNLIVLSCACDRIKLHTSSRRVKNLRYASKLIHRLRFPGRQQDFKVRLSATRTFHRWHYHPIIQSRKNAVIKTPFRPILTYDTICHILYI